jgi:hypothetical protein
MIKYFVVDTSTKLITMRFLSNGMATTRFTYGRNSRAVPLGIKIICVIGALRAVFGLFGGFTAFFSSPLGFVVGGIVVVLALAKLVVVWGLWTLQSWAWTLTMVVWGFGFLMDVLRLFTGNLAAIFGIVIGGLLLAYVYSKREYYK